MHSSMTMLLLLLALLGLATGQQHRAPAHGHMHHHKVPTTLITSNSAHVNAPSLVKQDATAAPVLVKKDEVVDYVFVVEGSVYSTMATAEVQRELAAGKLTWLPGESNPFAASTGTAAPSVSAALSSATAVVSYGSEPSVTTTSTFFSTIAATPSAQEATPKVHAQEVSSSSLATFQPAVYTHASIALPSSAVAASTESSSSSHSPSGLDKDFPDGQLACSHFPEEYGAINLDWLHLGGWSGIQTCNDTNGGFDNIVTKVSSQCSGNDCCSEGAYCSYACPPGYEKTQWPSTQGSTGQSVGGIVCRNGKLHLTNKGLSSKLCSRGSTAVAVKVNNTLTANVPICRTDYPGTEGETVPLDAQPGTMHPVTCPEESDYYDWEGKMTSAQYYVNPYGVSIKDACQWGSKSSNLGNFAPLNIGVGYTGGRAWLSIFQNAPTTNAKLNFTVEVVGDALSGRCRYHDGQYCEGDNYETCNTSDGCTVSADAGPVYFVLSE